MDSNTTPIGVHSTMSCTCIKLASSPGSRIFVNGSLGTRLVLNYIYCVCVFMFVVLGACVVCAHKCTPVPLSAVYTVQPQKGQHFPHKNAVGWWSRVCMYFGVGIEVH